MAILLQLDNILLFHGIYIERLDQSYAHRVLYEERRWGKMMKKRRRRGKGSKNAS